MEIIIKPTEACNGTCVYCSADGTLGKRKILPRESLGPLFDTFAEWMRGAPQRGLRFLWHGGEPMICGPEYYREVIQQQHRAFGDDLRRVKNAMQSNLSLVDDEWVPLLRDLLKGQAIGTSFDIVDGIRGLAGGRDLHEAWVRAVNLLRREGIRVGVVYVVHRRSLGRAADIYRFFRNIGLHVRVNPLYREGRADSGESQPLWITADEYGQFLVDLCEVWLADRMRCSVMPLMEWYRAWKGSSRLCCDSRGVCHTSHLGINPDGAVFGCGRQSDHRANLLGNIFEDRLDDLLQRREQGSLAGRSQGLRDGFCRDCRFWELCHGGCPMMGLLYHGDMLRETYFCDSRKRVYEHFESLFGPPVPAQAGGNRPPRRREGLHRPEARNTGGTQGSRQEPAPRFCVTIEQPDGWPMADAVRIITPNPDLPRLVAGGLMPGDRVRLLVAEDRPVASPEKYSALKVPLTVVASSPPPGSTAVIDHSPTIDLMRKLRAEMLFSPATIGDGSPACRAADAGVPVRLEFSIDYDESVLLRLLDHFLHTPTLQVPIEPFYSLAGAIGRHGKVTLWQLFDGSPGRCLFVDRQRSVSLSRWWAERGAFLGTVDDTPDAFKESALWKKMHDFADHFFITQTPCAFCEHYPYCGGIWRAMSELDVPCHTWQRVMDRLVQAYRGSAR